MKLGLDIASMAYKRQVDLRPERRGAAGGFHPLATNTSPVAFTYSPHLPPSRGGQRSGRGFAGMSFMFRGFAPTAKLFRHYAAVPFIPSPAALALSGGTGEEERSRGRPAALHRHEARWWRGEAAAFGRARIRLRAGRFGGVATPTSAKRARRARRVCPATTRARLGRAMIERQRPATQQGHERVRGSGFGRGRGRRREYKARGAEKKQGGGPGILDFRFWIGGAARLEQAKPAARQDAGRSVPIRFIRGFPSVAAMLACLIIEQQGRAGSNAAPRRTAFANLQ